MTDETPMHIRLADWLVELSDVLDRTGYRVAEEYPQAGSDLKRLGRQAWDWVDELIENP